MSKAVIVFVFDDDELADSFWGYWLDGGGEYQYIDGESEHRGLELSTDFQHDPVRMYEVKRRPSEDPSK